MLGDSKMQTSKLIAAVVVLCAGGMVGAAHAQSAKAAVTIKPLIALSQSAYSDGATNGDTGWVDVLHTQIKTANQKDLLFDVSMQCGIVTDTTVRSSGGSKSSSTARANIAVRVVVDGERIAEPTGSIDANGAPAEGVVFCDRVQTLAAEFAGLNCTADLTTGAVDCLDAEELQLILKTLNAHAFNFAMTDLSSGVHDIVVQARAQASVDFDDDVDGGSMSGAEAFAGAGALVVEEVRLVKGAELIEL